MTKKIEEITPNTPTTPVEPFSGQPLEPFSGQPLESPKESRKSLKITSCNQNQNPESQNQNPESQNQNPESQNRSSEESNSINQASSSQASSSKSTVKVPKLLSRDIARDFVNHMNVILSKQSTEVCGEYLLEEILASLDKQLQNVKEEESRVKEKEEWVGKKTSTAHNANKHLDTFDSSNMSGVYQVCLLVGKIVLDLVELHFSRGTGKLEARKRVSDTRKIQILKIRELVVKHLSRKNVLKREDVVKFGEFILHLSESEDD